MTNTIKLKRGSGSDPSASDMVVGEPVLRSDTAELFFKKDDGSVAKVSGGGGGSSGTSFKYLALRNAANDGAASYPGNDFTLVTSGTTTAVSPTTANALIVSYGGVVQKPNSGTSTSGITGFIIDGSRLKTATNFAAAPDFIIYQESAGIGTPSDGTVSESKLNVSNSPTNGYFLQAQSGNTGGLTWAQASVAQIAADDTTVVASESGSNQSIKINMNGTERYHFSGGSSNGFFTDQVIRLGSVSGSSSTGMQLNGTSTDSKIALFGSGAIKLISSTNAGDDSMAVFNKGGSVELYEDGNKKFETLDTGVSITGDLTATGVTNLSGELRANGNIKITNAGPKITFTDSGHNPDYMIQNADGALIFNDVTNAANRLVINTDGHVDVTGNLDVGAGLDVTGTCTATDFSGGRLSLLDNGSTSPTLLIAGDDGNPWGIQLRNDTYATGGEGLKIFQSNTGITYFQTRGTSARGRLVMQQHNGTTTNNMIEFTEAGAVEIDHAGTHRLSTTSSGLDIYGNEVHLYNNADTANTYFYAQNTGAGNAGIKMKNTNGEWTIIANDRLRFIDDDAGLERLAIDSSGQVLFSGLTANNDGRNAKGISLKSTSGISFEGRGSDGSRNWRIRPDDMHAWGALDFAVSPTANSNSDWPDVAGDVVLALEGSSKDVVVKNGNLKIGTAGKGINFSAYATSGNPSSNLLDDYEIGTFTPAITSGLAGTPTYSIRTGHYVKIGNKVHLDFYIRINDADANGSHYYVGGFPFNIKGANYVRGGGCSTYFSLNCGAGGDVTKVVGFYGRADNNEAEFYQGNTAVQGTNGVANDGLYVIGFFEYITDET